MKQSISKFLSKEGLLIAFPAVLVTVLGFWVAAQFIKPAPPSKIVIATGSEQGAYHRFGKMYAAELAKAGVTLQLKSTAGSVANIALLQKSDSGVDLALVQGGLATEDTSNGIVSLGRMFMEPVWVFYRASEDLNRLSALKGMKIAIGADGSGTRQLTVALLKPNGIDAATAEFLDIGGTKAAACLKSGACDAAFLVASPQSETVQDLLRDESIALMSFAQGEAMTRVFPFLARVDLPEGVIDFVRNIPKTDKTLVAAQAALVARDDIHPAIVGLLVNAAKRIHEKGGLFQKVGEYPKRTDPEFELSDAAEIAYNSGVPFLQRFLPFWLAIFIERMIVLIVPIATILLPLVKIGPWLYEWRVRRRLLYWYGQLKDLEHRIAMDPAREGLDSYRTEIERISESVRVIPVPLTFSDRFYELQAAVDLVRQRLSQQN